MGRQADYIRKKYGPLQARTLKNVLAHRIEREFPRIGGPRIRQLCAEMILEVVGDHIRPTEHVTHGQILWMAVSVDDPPSYHKRIVDTDLVPVVLTLSDRSDIESRLHQIPPEQRRLAKALRLCQQAYKQGAVLSNCDLAELLTMSERQIGSVLAAHERDTGTVVPRRATVHDVGTGLTHKRIICYKRYAEGKSSDQIARETYHSTEAVDRYLGQYDRVRHCRLQGMTPQETAHTLACSLSLVKEYLDIDAELETNDA
jgi:DNA-binding CsgD family transcriptional regulator